MPGSMGGQLSVESGALADPQVQQLDRCPNAHSSEQLYIEVSEKMTFVYLLCVNVICVTLSCVDMLVCVCVSACARMDIGITMCCKQSPCVYVCPSMCVCMYVPVRVCVHVCTFSTCLSPPVECTCAVCAVS